jgi:hypothetical protein
MVSPLFPPSDLQGAKNAERAGDDKSVRLRLLRRLQLGLLRLGVECCVEDDGVTLSGAVSSYYEKQLAQEIVMKVDRALRVTNRCEVKRDKH